jgi:hypothetical protein
MDGNVNRNYQLRLERLHRRGIFEIREEVTNNELPVILKFLEGVFR